MRIGSYVQALCKALCTARAAPRRSERSLPHGAVAQRVIDLTESVAGRGVRWFFAGPGRALVALGTDDLRGAAKPQAKRVFSRFRVYLYRMRASPLSRVLLHC